jgi:hypothetical protein
MPADPTPAALTAVAERLVVRFGGTVPADTIQRVLHDEYHALRAASDGIAATIGNIACQWAMFPETYEFEIVNLAASYYLDPALVAKMFAGEDVHDLIPS